MNQDQIAGASRNLGGKIEEGAGRAMGDVKTQIEGKIRQAAGTAQEFYGEARDRTAEAASSVKKQASSFETALRETIETRPYTAVLAAFAVGWFVGHFGRSYD